VGTGFVKRLILKSSCDTARARISHAFVGRTEQTHTLPELRSLHYGYFREDGINGENCVCAVPARLRDLVPAYGEKWGLVVADHLAAIHCYERNKRFGINGVAEKLDRSVTLGNVDASGVEAVRL